ncbi:hypothetical protein OY671_012565, partial [Metschnikowia pulcherrima]
DAPERTGVELLGPRAGTMRQMGEDPRTREIGEGRGAGETKAAAERQPRRGMFDGLKSSAEPAKAAEPAPDTKDAAKEKAAPKRGMFDGSKSPQPTPAPTTDVPARAEPGHTHDFRRVVARASRSAAAVLPARASRGPVPDPPTAAPAPP